LLAANLQNRLAGATTVGTLVFAGAISGAIAGWNTTKQTAKTTSWKTAG
jgi:hypothetical protein